MSKEKNNLRKRKSEEIIEEVRPEVKRMPKPHVKTPIMILQELCAKKNPRDLPVYIELSEAPEEFAEAGMRFFIKCQAFRLEAIGAGVTKKIAKHTAAEKLLNKFYKNDDDNVEMLQFVDTNCISDLLDYCVVKGYQKPEFTYVSTCGPSHAPSFTFKCKLNSIERTAEAGSKQLAKQLSAKSVFDVIKMSFPDIEKKLSVVHDTPQQHEAKVRHKITTYLDLKKKTKDGEFKGTSIKDRHMFFRAQDAELVDCLLEILRSTDEEEEKFQKLVMELETMWTVSFGKFLETDMMKFEVEIDYEKFTCVVIGAEKNIKGNVLQYFCEMMDIDFEETVEGGSMSPLEDVSVHSYGSCEENVLEK